MTDWLILTEGDSDLSQADTPHKVMRIADYLARPTLFDERRPYVINLARSYAYQSAGYYASLLAEARGHRVSPTVQTMVELSGKDLYSHALPDLNAKLVDALGKGAPAADKVFVAFSRAMVSGYERLGREVSDWFRVPALELSIETSNGSAPRIARVRPVSPSRMTSEQRGFFLEALAAYTRAPVKTESSRPPAKWSLAVLADPAERTPPSQASDLKRLVSVAAKMRVDVEILDPSDLPSLAEFDALFIRMTTAINNVAYRFARRAEQEGMPVIDDPTSMIRCTNKVYLKEILGRAGIPMPKTEVIDRKSDLAAVFTRLGSPVILKTPDGSFGQNMVKAHSLEELQKGVERLFENTALLIAQAFVPTKFDWRIGVLGGEPLYACRYQMARGHWQIVKHGEDGKMTEGGASTLSIADAPAEVVDTAVRAARLIGDGLYGVDLKETPDGVVVIEINDNPNLEHETEGGVLKNELWMKIVEWFALRLEQRMKAASTPRS